MAENGEKKASNCSICGNAHSNPKMLKCCHHVFCQKCLEKQVEQDQPGRFSLTCPDCHQMVPVSAGVIGLESNFHSNPLQEVFKEHLNGKICSEHDLKEELFCETCSQLLCKQCFISGSKHQGHLYCNIGESFEKFKEEATPLLAASKEQLVTATKALTVLDEHCDEISSLQTDIRAQIESRSEALHDMIDKREEELMSQLDEIMKRKLDYFEMQRKEIESIQFECSEWSDSTREILGIENPPQKASETTSRVEDQKTEPFVLIPITKINVEFSTLTDEEVLCSSHGNIFSPDSPDPLKCVITGKGAEEVTLGEMATAILRAATFRDEPFETLSPSTFFEAEIVSDMTGSKLIGCVERSVKHRQQGEYHITYKPSVKGMHQLHIKANGQHIRGSPYRVAVKVPVETLKTPVLVLGDLVVPKGIAVNGRGDIVVTESDAHCISVFSPSGEKIRSFGMNGSGNGHFKNPLGVAADGERNLVVIDYKNHRIQKFTEDGEFLVSADGRGSGLQRFKYPTDVAYNSTNDKLYIVDYQHCVRVLNSDLTFFNMFAREGSGEGQLRSPCGITTDSAGLVYVADSGNHRIQVFTAEGEYLRMFGKEGAKKGEVNWPRGIAVDTNGFVYVSDNRRVSVFTSEGGFVKSLGKVGASGRYGPYGLAMDGSGVLYVCDSCNNNVEIY